VTPAANVSIAPYTTLGIGGPARWYVEAFSIEQIGAAVEWAAARAVPLFVLGGGSNLVFADEGFPGLVLHVRIDGVTFEQDAAGTVVTAGAGESWDVLVAASVSRGLSGVECLSGIPGTVGGTPVQNVGAYGQDVGRVIERVDVFDTQTHRFQAFSAKECAFGYRTSRFKGGDAARFIVCRVIFRLRSGAPTVTYPDLIAYLEQHAIMTPDLADVRKAILAIRRRKGMVLDPDDTDTRSVGSFFVNPVVPAEVHRAIAARLERVPAFETAGGEVKIPAAWLIEHAGIGRGFALGAAATSSKHPLAIVNRGGAAARDIVSLAVHIKRTVVERFGIALRPEPVFVGFDGNADVEYLRSG
jgi:UDP-N-acetylmuramate dehydrogenase